jgi:hypothetical protein
MQIHEITYRKLDEAAMGSVGAQAKVFSSALGSALTQKIAPGLNPGSQSSMAFDPQAKAKLLTEPAVQALAKKQAILWNAIISDLMSKTKTSTGAQAVSVKDIPPAQIKNALLQQVNTKLLSTISGNQLTDYQDLTDKINSTDPAAKKAADDTIRAINVAVDSILATEPVEANKGKMAQAWLNLVANVYQAANMAKFQSSTPGAPTPSGAKVPAGQRLKVVLPNKSVYYKTYQGTWTNEVGKTIPNQASINDLEKAAATGAATLERV